jgi:GNAT superfamily N-acetyltransferase
MPAGDTRVHVPFEEFRLHEDRSILMHDGCFLAVDGDRYVGMTELFLSGQRGDLRTGLTAVRRAYRRRGIALALKACSLGWAKAQGYRQVITDNEANNRGMLSINEHIGFVKSPPWLHYVKTFAA